MTNAMRYLDLALPTPTENLALDEALLLVAEPDGGEVLRVWEWPRPAVVLGSGCKIADDVEADACRADGVPVLRRSSGGGTVLLGKGCLLFSLVLDTTKATELGDVRRSYAAILARVTRSLLPEAAGAEVCGISDLAIGGRKFSGNAQQRKQRYILHHGTLLYSFDTSVVARYLCLPPRQPEYRGGRPHSQFLTNLPLSSDELKRRLRQEWGAVDENGSLPHDEVARLTTEKYTTREWVERR
jgi:lipoate---protein ligase